MCNVNSAKSKQLWLTDLPSDSEVDDIRRRRGVPPTSTCNSVVNPTFLDNPRVFTENRMCKIEKCPVMARIPESGQDFE